MWREEWVQPGGHHTHWAALGAKIAGRYALTRELARGGMGAVWEARDLETDDWVAIKLQPSLPGRVSVRRFEREVQALHRLQHPHVVRILDSGYQPGLSYLVMELLRGETLREHLTQRGPLPLTEAATLIEQAATGLQAVHALQIVHRDVKLSNLFLAAEGSSRVLKLIDFGIAKGHTADAHDATGSGIVGSPAYMSPEQTRGERVDSRTDSWALAVVAFTLLAGTEPFTESTLPATLTRIGSGRARQDLAGALPEALRVFFKTAFRVDPELRFQTVSELADAFSRACAGIGASAPGRVESTVSLRLSQDHGAGVRRARPLIAALLATGALASAGWALRPEPAASAHPPARPGLVEPSATAQPARSPLLAEPQTTLAPPSPSVLAKPAGRARERPALRSEAALIPPASTPASAGPAPAEPPEVASHPRQQDPLDRRF